MLHQLTAHMHKKTSYGFMLWIEQNIVICDQIEDIDLVQVELPH